MWTTVWQHTKLEYKRFTNRMTVISWEQFYQSIQLQSCPDEHMGMLYTASCTCTCSTDPPWPGSVGRLHTVCYILHPVHVRVLLILPGLVVWVNYILYAIYYILYMYVFYCLGIEYGLLIG